MQNQELYFNSLEAAKILGVNVSSIKRWTEEGRLACLKTAGGHRKFMMIHLVNYIKKNKKATQKLNLFPLEGEEDLQINHQILNRNYTFLTEYTMGKSLLCHTDRVQQILNGLYLSDVTPHEIYDRLITPVLTRIGELWETGKITVFKEHIASQTIRDALIRLQGIIPVPSQKRERVFCWSLSTELHDIALKMVQHLLETRGFDVFFTGQRTPAVDLDIILSSFKPRRIYISSSYVPDTAGLQEELLHLFDLSLSKNINVFVGGRGFDRLSYDHPAVKKRLYTFEEVYVS